MERGLNPLGLVCSLVCHNPAFTDVLQRPVEIKGEQREYDLHNCVTFHNSSGEDGPSFSHLLIQHTLRVACPVLSTQQQLNQHLLNEWIRSRTLAIILYPWPSALTEQARWSRGQCEIPLPLLQLWSEWDDWGPLLSLGQHAPSPQQGKVSTGVGWRISIWKLCFLSQWVDAGKGPWGW